MERSFELDYLRRLQRDAETRRLRGQVLSSEEQREADDELREIERDAIAAQKRLNRTA